MVRKVGSIKFNYWFKMCISFFAISLLVSLSSINQFFYKLILESKIEIFLILASINGAFFAIFFSVMLIAIQHSASNYLPSILSNFRKDPKLIFVIILSLVGILFNLFIYLSGYYSFILVSAILFLINFLAIIFYFYEILNFVNPLFMVENKKQEILKKIGLNKSRTLRRVKKSLKKNFSEKILPLGLACEAKLNSKEYAEENIEFIDELFNHIERSRAINDPETYKKSLEGLSEVIDLYLSTKKVDLQSDTCISHVLTKLNLQANFLLKNEDHFKIVEIIKTLEKIGISSLGRLKAVNINGINYTSSLICYYLTKIGKKSIESGDLDLVAKVVVSLENVAMASIERNLSTTMIEARIKELSDDSKDWFMYNNSLNSLGKLLIYLIESIPKKKNLKKVLPEQDLHLLIKYQSEILNKAVKKYGGYLEISGAVSPIFGVLSEVKLSKIINKLLWLSQNPPKEIATHNYETMSKTFIKGILNYHKETIKKVKEHRATIVLIDYKRELLESLKELNRTKLKTYDEGFKEEISLIEELIEGLDGQK